MYVEGKKFAWVQSGREIPLPLTHQPRNGKLPDSLTKASLEIIFNIWR